MTAEERRRQAAHDAAQVAMLQALAPERLQAILEALGVPAEHTEAVAHRQDPRRCLECGYGYVRCRQLDEKVPEPERHAWQPDRGRSDG